MAYRKVEESSLTAVADAIRAQSGSAEALEFPDGFVEAVGTLSASAGSVTSVNGQTGAVVLDAEDVGAQPKGNYALKSEIPTVPTKVSELGNDAGFITAAAQDLENYYRKSETYTQAQVDQLVSKIPKFAIAVVSELPVSGISETTIYLVPGGDDGNLYTEYIRVSGAWEILGTQRVDLTGYATESYVTAQLAGYQPKGDYALKTELPSKLSELAEDTTHRVVTDAEKAAWDAKSDFSGAYADLTGKPTIPTVPAKVSAFENDARYLTEDKLPDAVEDALTQAKASGEFDGEPGYTPVRGTDYWTDADKAELVEDLSNTLPENQAFVQDVAELVPIVKVAESPTFVDSVEDMTDTDKPYVLTADGMIYAYGESTQTVVTEAQNRFDPSAATISARMSGSSGSVSGTAALGSFVTDFIPVTGFADNDPFNVELNFEAKLHGDDKFCLFDSSKALIKGATFSSGSAWHPNVTVGDGKTIINIRKDNSGNAISDANVAYIRLQVYMRTDGSGGVASTALTADEIANVTIKYQHESSTTTETVTGFYSTGIVYNQPADYEDRVIELETDVANNTGNIALLQKRVGNLESGETETVIPTFWEDAVSECISKIKALQVGRNCITFPFFSDNHQRLGYSGVLISKVMEECHIPYCIYSGDSISSGYIDSEETMIAQDKAFNDMMQAIPNGRFCRAVGNHDGYWAVSASEKYTYTREQVYELFLREESIAQNKHFGGDGTYYYVDDIASKVRFIVLNTNGGSVDATQLAWMQDTALSFNESGWAVVFISHQPISNHYHANISNAAEVRTAVQDYINGSASNKAAVVAWFSGHIHRDRIYTGAATNTSDDTEGTAMGFTQVTITSDHTGIAYDDSTKHTVANDDQSHAIDFVTINKTTRTVNLTRLGIGIDRSFTY